MTDLERLTIEPLTDTDGETATALIEILRKSFGGTVEGWTEFCTKSGTTPETDRAGGTFVARHDGDLIGGYSVYDMGQFFGGRSVKLGGFAGVGIAPHLRGQGLASHMMRLGLRRLRDQGFPLAGLYASNMPLYRKVGFEQAGVRYSHQLALETIGIRREPDCPLTRVEPDDPRFRDLYAAWASDGNLDRNEAIWWRSQRVRGEDQIHAYLAGPADTPEGYVVIAQAPPGEPWGYRLTLRDFVATTGRAARRIWALLGSMSTLGRTVQWNGPALDPRVGHLPDCHAVQIGECERNFLRILDVKAALEARGYPAGIEGTLALSITDDDMAENTGDYVLEVTEGRGTVRPGGTGDARLDVRGLAALFSGFLTPRQLRLNGWLDADEGTVATATRLFAGDPPWMPDHY